MDENSRYITYRNDIFTVDVVDTLTHNNSFLLTGKKITVSTTDTLPTGLSALTNYYIIKISDTTCKLASSYINAIAGTEISITNGTGAGEHSIVSSIGSSIDGYFDNVYGNDIYQWGQKVSVEGHTHSASETTMLPLTVLDKLLNVVNTNQFDVNHTDLLTINKASPTKLGLIRIGTGLTIDENGIVNAAAGGAGAGTWGSITGNIADQTDLSTALGLKLASSSYTAADVLAKILTVDGTGSLLDADKLDGNEGAWYAPIDSPSFTTKITSPIVNATRFVADGLVATHATALYQGLIDEVDSYRKYIYFKNEDASLQFQFVNGSSAGSFIPSFEAYNKYTNVPGLYLMGNATNGTSTPIVGFDGRKNNTSADATDMVFGFATGYGNYKAWMLGNGNWGFGFSAPLSKVSINGGLHVGGASDAGDNNLMVDGNITPKIYVSQTTGYRVTSDGQADFRYIFADEMHVKSFIADLEQALAGGQIITKSVAKVNSDFTIPAAGASGSLVVEEFAGFTGHVFADGDIIRLRQFVRDDNTTVDISDVWGTVVYVSRTASDPPVQTYTFTRSVAPNAGAGSGTISKGTLALDYGTSGQGIYEVTAIDGMNGVNSPYSQCLTWTGHPATGTVLKQRSGNLSGIVDASFPSISGYGLYADNVYLKGNIVATAGYIGGTSGWAITSGLISSVNGANTTAMASGGTNAYIAGTTGSPQFIVTHAGELTATGVAEIGTATANYGGSNDWNVAIKGADIYENSFNNHGGTIYINNIGFNGGTTYGRDTVIGNGKNTALMANFQGNDDLINFSATTITLTGTTAMVGAATISTTLSVTGASTFTGLLKTVGGVHIGGTSDPGTDNLIVDGTVQIGGKVGIGGTPGTYAALEIESMTGALILPRMTKTQRDAMTGEVGMIIYNTYDEQVQAWIGGGINAWRVLN